MRDGVWSAGTGLGLLLTVLAAGCAGLGELGAWSNAGSEVRSTAPEAQPHPVAEVLARAAALTPEEAQRLLPGAVDAFRTERSPKSRVWVLLLVLRAPPREFGDAWALEVLEAARAGREGAGDYGALESLLEDVFAARLQQASARRRAEAGAEGAREDARALQVSLREARLALDAERGRVQAVQREQDELAARVRPLQASLEEERRRAADLQGQLEQLKTIEKILERREGPAPGEGAQ